MKILVTAILCALLAVPCTGYPNPVDSFPESIGTDPALAITGEVKAWSPDNMFEHVNGEAELLIRYGALSLSFVSYENGSGDYVSVDILDLGEPINAYGLFRLYSGCDGEELTIHGATVLADEYTQYALWGQYFLRINLDISDNTNTGSALVADFLKHFSEHVPERSPLPSTLEILQLNARNPCEVNYHPEHIDYDLETGPGYSWVGKDGNSYSAVVLESEERAELRYRALKGKGVAHLLLWKNGVIWNTADDGEPTDDMKETIRQIVENL